MLPKEKGGPRAHQSRGTITNYNTISYHTDGAEYTRRTKVVTAQTECGAASMPASVTQRGGCSSHSVAIGSIQSFLAISKLPEAITEVFPLPLLAGKS
jgi:hypothetical protein